MQFAAPRLECSFFSRRRDIERSHWKKRSSLLCFSAKTAALSWLLVAAKNGVGGGRISTSRSLSYLEFLFSASLVISRASVKHIPLQMLIAVLFIKMSWLLFFVFAYSLWLWRTAGADELMSVSECARGAISLMCGVDLQESCEIYFFRQLAVYTGRN